MISPQVVTFIQAQLAHGMTPEKIHALLSAKGWSTQDIADSFAAATPRPAVAHAVAAEAPLSGKIMLSAGLIFASIIYSLAQSGAGASLATAPLGGTAGQTAAATTPAQSYKAANEALLQTINQISATGAKTPPKQTTSAPTQTTPSSQTPTTQSTPAATPAATTKPTGQYVDGSYTGSPADAYYGTVQVKAIISGGKIADVQFLQHPNSHSSSVYINNQAMPLLTQEAIQAQSANVSGVSGATFTSQAFIQSLSSALSKAKA